jgi:hypothetical protein
MLFPEGDAHITQLKFIFHVSYLFKLVSSGL